MTVATSDSIQSLYVIYFGRAADPAGLQFWRNSGASFEQISAAFATADEAKNKYPYLAFPTLTTPESFITELYQNAFNRAPDAQGLAFWTAQLQAGVPPSTVVDNIYSVLNSSGTDAQTQSDKASLTNKTSVANNFTQGLVNNSITPTESLLGNSSTIIAGVDSTAASVTTANQQVEQVIAAASGSTGQTRVFTTGIDTLVGGIANDVFIGDNSGTTTVQAADQVNGGGGQDTFKYYSPTPNVLPSLVDVETVELPALTANVPLDFTPVAGKGITQVTLTTPTVDQTNLKGLKDIALGVNSATADKNFTADFEGATAVTFSITKSQVGTVNLNGTGVKTINLVAEGTGNTILDLKSTGPEETLNVSGTGSVKVATKVDDGITTIDATANKGGLDIKADNKSLVFKGSEGADTLTMDSLDEASLNGAGGQDTLILGNTDATVAAFVGTVNKVQNFETLGFNGANSTVDVKQITAFKDFLFDTPGTIKVLNTSSTTTLTLKTTAASLEIDNTALTTETTANLVLKGDGVETGGITLTKISTLNVTSTKDEMTADNKLTSFTKNGDGLKIVVTGNQDLTIGSPQAGDVKASGVLIDAGAFTGKLTATGTIGADIITGGTKADILTGLTGNDIFSYPSAVNSNAGTLTGDVTFDTIKNFSATGLELDKLRSPLFTPANLVDQTIVQNAVTASGGADLAGVIQAAATAIGASKYGAFQIGGNTYVLGNDATVDTVGAGDLLVKLEGNVTLGNTNFIV